MGRPQGHSFPFFVLRRADFLVRLGHRHDAYNVASSLENFKYCTIMCIMSSICRFFLVFSQKISKLSVSIPYLSAAFINSNTMTCSWLNFTKVKKEKGVHRHFSSLEIWGFLSFCHHGPENGV